MIKWLSNLLKPAPAEPAEAARVSSTPKEDRPRMLTPLDVPMIQARLQTLGIYEALDPRYEDRLKRLVQEQCRERKEGMWWTPLQEFAQEMQFRRQGAPVLVLDARCEDLDAMAERIIGFSELLLGSGVQLRGARMASGDTNTDVTGLVRLQLSYRRAGTDGVITARSEDGVIDVPALVGELNRMLIAGRWGRRLLMLPPHGTLYAVVRCEAQVAARAERTNWGSTCAA